MPELTVNNNVVRSEGTAEATLNNETCQQVHLYKMSSNHLAPAFRLRGRVSDEQFNTWKGGREKGGGGARARG